MKKYISSLCLVLAWLLAACAVLPPAVTTEPIPTDDVQIQTSFPPVTSLPTETVLPTETILPTETVIPTETVLPTETVRPTETLPPPSSVPGMERYLLSFAGDCTFGDNINNTSFDGVFSQVVGDNFAYPFANVLQYFGSDELTLVNLECALTTYEPTEEEILDLKLHEKTFRFRTDPKYVQVLTAGSVEAVSAANNHSTDFGWPGHKETREVLKNAGIRYATWGSNSLIQTPNGLVIGIYANQFRGIKEKEIQANVEKLRSQGAQIVICSFHWGVERAYMPNEDQQKLAHAAIDAGADIVFGHHPHVLQPMEIYNGGLILYSMGNFSFGGNRNPADRDTAIIQQEIIRYPDGSVVMGETIIIPCCLSSKKSGNNFQPTPYTPGSSGYNRVMSKLDWSYADQWQAEQDAATAPTETVPPTQTTGSTETT